MWGAIPTFAKNKGGDLRVNPIQTQQPTFGVRINGIKRYNGNNEHKIITKATLENGKQIIIADYFQDNKLIHKLQYLKDSAGKWIKSKLKYYENNKIVQIIRS